MFVAINANTPATVPRLETSRSRSPIAANMDSNPSSPHPMDSLRVKPLSWTDDHKEKFQEIITSLGSTVGTTGAPTSHAQLFDLASKKLADLGIIKSTTQCKDKWYRMSNRAENEALFNFTRGGSKHGTFGDDKLEVVEPVAEEPLDSNFAQDEDSLIAGNRDEINADSNDVSGHRSTMRWDDRERDFLIELVRGRRELELQDTTQPVFNAGQLFKYASTELQKQYGIERTVSSCTIFWRRNVAGTFGFGSGNEATKLLPGSNSASKTMKIEEAPSMTLRETPTKSKRLQNSLQEPQSPKEAKQPKPPKPAARASSPKLGRKFTTAQKEALAAEAEKGLNPSQEVRARLVQELNLTGQQVSGYFGNARFKARKLELMETPKEADGDEGADEDVSPMSITAQDSGAPDSEVKKRKYRKRKHPTSIDSDDEPLLAPLIKHAPQSVDSDASFGVEEKVYGSRSGMLRRKAPVRDPSLPFLPPPSYEDSMLKASPNPYGSPRNPPHLSRSPLPTEPTRSSSSRLSLEPLAAASSSLRDSNASAQGSITSNTAPASATSAATPNVLLNLPPPADDQQMESILASKVSRIDEEMSVLLKRIDDQTVSIQADQEAINDLDRQNQVIQARRAAALAARQQKEVTRAEYSNRIQVLGNRKSQIANALRDLKAAFEDDN
ncbi:hypothetical protein WAI453_009153 [Rhynchosporium graminicola]